jgi:hypothetical protein
MNNIGAFNLLRHEWKPILPYLDADLAGNMISVLPTFQWVGSVKHVLNIIPKRSEFSTFFFRNVHWSMKTIMNSSNL